MLLERGIRFDVPHTVFASHGVTHDVFCKIVNFGPFWCSGVVVQNYRGHKTNYIVIGTITLMLLAFL